MSSPEAFDAIETLAKAVWTATPIVFENDDWPLPGTPAAFLFVEVFGDFFGQESIGAENQRANLWREAGQVHAHVLVPRGRGSRNARLLARQFIDLFRGETISGVVFRDASIGAGEPGAKDGNYFRMTATIDWERDE